MTLGSFTAGRIRILGLCLLATILLATATLYFMSEVREADREKGLAAGDDALWGSSQFQIELIRFQNTLQALAANPGAEHAEEVVLRFEILLSRASVLREILVRRQDHFGHDNVPIPAVEAYERRLLGYEGAIAALRGGGGLDRLPAILDDLPSLIRDSQEISAAIMHLQSMHTQSLRERVADLNQYVFIVTTTFIGTTIFLLFISVVLLFRSESQRQETLRLNEALKVEKERAQKANEAKTDFVSRMSHEFRTPLNAVLGFSKLMMMCRKEAKLASVNWDELEKWATYINNAGRHLLDLVNELLDLAKIEHGKIDVSMQSVQLAPLIEECVARVGGASVGKDIPIDFDVSKDGAVHVAADPLRLSQVLINLLSNAVKYNRPGGRVWIRIGEADGGRVRVEVEDTGIGIPQEKLAAVFEPFERVIENGSHVEGTGIGLTISRLMMQLMGGEIGVDSTFGSGSRFWIVLNAEPASRAAELTPTHV